MLVAHNELAFCHFPDLPERIQPINKNGIVISFECQPMFSNVMDIKIMALNTTPVPLSEVVMELIAPHVSSCPLILFSLRNCIFNSPYACLCQIR